jgi:hypothetical protein
MICRGNATNHRLEGLFDFLDDVSESIERVARGRARAARGRANPARELRGGKRSAGSMLTRHQRGR